MVTTVRAACGDKVLQVKKLGSLDVHIRKLLQEQKLVEKTAARAKDFLQLLNCCVENIGVAPLDALANVVA